TGTRRGGSAAKPGPGQLRERGGPGHGTEPVRGRPQRLVLLVTELDLGGRDVVFQLLDAGRARDRYHGRVVDYPGQRDLCRGGGVRVRHLTQDGDQVTGPVEVVREEERAGRPEPVRRPVGPVIPAGQQPLRQRAVGDHHAVVRLGERQQILLR